MREPVPERSFQGVWIPKEIWDSPELSWLEKCLLAEIRSLEKEEGCYASNEWLAKRFGTTEPALKMSISRLRKAGWIVDLGFDGRRRRIAVFVKGSREAISATFAQPECYSRGNPHVTPEVTPTLPQNGPAYIRENSEKNVPPIPQELRGLGALGEGSSEWEVPTPAREPDPDPPPRLHGKSKVWNPTPEQVRLNKLFNRRATTRWSEKELKAWKLVTPIDERDLEVLERYYGYQLPEAKDYRRRDLQTLLNNFLPEVDRARRFREPKPW